MAVKTFSVGETLTASDTNTYLANSGLVYVGGTAFTNTATPFINGCFSSTYDNYRIVLSLISTNAANTVARMRVRSGTSTTETGAVYDRYGFSVSSAGVLASETIADRTSMYVGGISITASTRLVSSMDVYNPNLAVHTNINMFPWFSSAGEVAFLAHRIETTTQYTGVELLADAGNLTGSMYVYGYRQA